jgi:hypothetical protein
VVASFAADVAVGHDAAGVPGVADSVDPPVALGGATEAGVPAVQAAATVAAVVAVVAVNAATAANAATAVIAAIAAAAAAAVPAGVPQAPDAVESSAEAVLETAAWTELVAGEGRRRALESVLACGTEAAAMVAAQARWILWCNHFEKQAGAVQVRSGTIGQ